MTAGRSTGKRWQVFLAMRCSASPMGESSRIPSTPRAHIIRSRCSAGSGRHFGACRGRTFPVWRSHMAGNRLRSRRLGIHVRGAGGGMAGVCAPISTNSFPSRPWHRASVRLRGDSLSGVGFETDGSGQVSVTTDGQGKLPRCVGCRRSVVITVVRARGQRCPGAQAPVIEVDAEDMPQRLTFQEAVDKGVVGPIGTFTTTYTTGQGTENRNHNIELVSQILDNSICKSGETWSYNGTTGIATRRRGVLRGQAPSSMASTPVGGRRHLPGCHYGVRCGVRGPVFRSSSATIIRSTSPAIRPDAMRPSRTPNLTLCGETTPPAMFW